MDPKQFLSIKPIPSASHVGLKITARSSNPNYTCEYPRRPSVAKGNYRRRKYQIDNCGYRSVSTKPYQEVGNVVLDSRKLILSTLGQEEKPEEKEVVFVECLLVRKFCECFSVLNNVKKLSNILRRNNIINNNLPRYTLNNPLLSIRCQFLSVIFFVYTVDSW